uniref:Uncharacterized protein n=1 Tax=Anguilla anguilla TaxID=7936 RepID=A0A0E9XK51_ANGAN
MSVMGGLTNLSHKHTHVHLLFYFGKVTNTMIKHSAFDYISVGNNQVPVSDCFQNCLIKSNCVETEHLGQFWHRDLHNWVYLV